MDLLRRRPLHLLSAGRGAAGVAMLARPALLPRALGVDSTTASRLTWMTRMVGARELAVGAGTLLALRRGRHVEEWALAALLCDGVDAAAFGTAVAKGDVRQVPGAVLVLTAASGVALAAMALRDLRG
ncbi:MAG TPA: hypothetical protein VGX28_12635 [Frankiaceae bacterium]|jgi:hypothetical protein|nr:hypothetical protein [Frankiaceae bacterium]